MNNFGLPEQTIAILKAIFAEESEIEKVILYGSRAKGTYKNGSDIDLTLTGDNLSEALRSRLANKCDEAPIPYEIDLSLLSQIQNKDLKDHIQRVGKVFYTKR